MNVFNNVKCRWDYNGEIWFDLRVPEITFIQKAALIGGQIAIYHVNHVDLYYMSYHYKNGKVNIQTFGCEITEDQYNSQLLAWDGENYINFDEGTELTLIDNTYFLKPCSTKKLTVK